ncbi:hypothetical protein HY483_02575 [Candidatus Woesearchaeota archaeon]|nr:hypothetical protein [Candidatus Woesearchaeota archaeon]
MTIDDVSNSSNDSDVPAGENSAALLSVSVARNLCSMYKDELDRKKRQWLDTCRGNYRRQSPEWFEHDMHSEEDLSPGRLFEIEEAHVLEEVAGIACALERCVDPNAEVLQDYSRIVDEATQIYGEQRLNVHIVNARARAEEVAGAKLPLTQRKIIASEMRGDLVLALYEAKSYRGSWGEEKISYLPSGGSYIVPRDVFSSFPRPSTIAFVVKNQIPEVNVDASLQATSEQNSGLRRKVSDASIKLALEELLSDRSLQYDLQQLVDEHLMK